MKNGVATNGKNVYIKPVVDAAAKLLSFLLLLFTFFMVIM